MAGRQRKGQILFHTLRLREIGGKGRGIQSATILTRQIYSAITPNETLYKVELPDSLVPRRFTPDGKFLIGFTRQGDSIRLYSFRYPARPAAEAEAEAGQSPEQGLTEIMQSTTNDQDDRVKMQAATFGRYFQFRYHSQIVEEQRHALCKEFCLVTTDHQYMILASSAHSRCSPEESRPFLCSLDSIAALMDTIIYTVDIQTGQVIDKLSFQNDYIVLPQHAGVSLFQNLFAVMSVQNQTIHLFQVMGSGRLRKLRAIGWFNNEDEESLLRQQMAKEAAFRQSQEHLKVHGGVKRTASMAELDRPSTHGQASSVVIPSIVPHIWIPPSTTQSSRLNTETDEPLTSEPDNTMPALQSSGNEEDDDGGVYQENPGLISGFRQKFMIYLYRKAILARDGGVSLRHFYCNFDVFAQMKLWRMQLLSGNKLLIKLNNVTHASARQADASIQMAVFVIYNMATTEVESVFDNSSSSVLDFYEEYADILRGIPHDGITWHGSTYTNSELAKDTLKRQIYVWRYAKNGGRGEAMRRLALSFPQCPQSYLECPYFDLALFSFDEKFVSSLDGPKSSQGTPIKFYVRKSGRMKFKIDPNPMPFLNGGDATTTRRFMTFIPHPTLPFIISKQHVMMRPTIVNFHVYNELYNNNTCE